MRLYIKPALVHTGSSHTLYLLAGTIMRLYIKAALPCSVHTGSSHTLYLLAGTIMRFTSKPHFLAQCIQALHIRCTSLLVQLCVYTSNPHSKLFTYAPLPCSVHTWLSTYAVPPCWYNYAFIHQTRTSLQAIHTLFFLASIIMRLHIKAAFPCSVHTGSSHMLYFLASIIIRLHINQICISLLSAVHTGFLAQCIQALHIRCTSLLVQLCVYTSKPHFLAQCIQAIHIRCTSLLVRLCVLHQIRTSLLSAYRLFPYAVPPCWYNYAFYIKAALTCSVHTCSSHTLYLLAGTNRSHTSLLSAYRLSTYAVPPCWYIYAFIHQTRTSLLSAYRLFTYAVPPCWYNYAFYIKAALPCSVRTGSSHTLYFLASIIMLLYIKPAFPCSVHSGSSHTLYFLASIIMLLYIKPAFPCSVHTGSSHMLYFLASIIIRLHITQICISLLSASNLFTYAVLPC